MYQIWSLCVEGKQSFRSGRLGGKIGQWLYWYRSLPYVTSRTGATLNFTKSSLKHAGNEGKSYPIFLGRRRTVIGGSRNGLFILFLLCAISFVNFRLTFRASVRVTVLIRQRHVPLKATKVDLSYVLFQQRKDKRGSETVNS